MKLEDIHLHRGHDYRTDQWVVELRIQLGDTYTAIQLRQGQSAQEVSTALLDLAAAVEKKAAPKT